MKKVGCCYHPRLPDDQGRRFAEELLAVAAEHVGETWSASAWDKDATRRHVPGTDLLICIGGDGTVLRAARAVVPHETLLLGVNMGHLGFLSELDAAAAVERLPEVLAGAGRIEERAMLHAEIVAPPGTDGDQTPARHDALNDVVIGRAEIGRTVQIDVSVDGSPLADYRADGVIVATATGSTAYSLSAGGPILPPESREILLTPLAPHLASSNSIVLPPSSLIEVHMSPERPATLSIDGERDLDLTAGEMVRVALGPYCARFVRLDPPARFYERLARRLGWLGQIEGDASGASATFALSEKAPA